ncbi:hypothetical protein C2E23DRAFT_847718 [Lenzites betulinus]|nr:hypothetical protein C2E23DRAFT_847718 [Lenzites betulinus]
MMHQILPCTPTRNTLLRPTRHARPCPAAIRQLDATPCTVRSSQERAGHPEYPGIIGNTDEGAPTPLHHPSCAALCVAQSPTVCQRSLAPRRPIPNVLGMTAGANFSPLRPRTTHCPPLLRPRHSPSRLASLLDESMDSAVSPSALSRSKSSRRARVGTREPVGDGAHVSGLDRPEDVRRVWDRSPGSDGRRCSNTYRVRAHNSGVRMAGCLNIIIDSRWPRATRSARAPARNAAKPKRSGLADSPVLVLSASLEVTHTSSGHLPVLACRSILSTFRPPAASTRQRLTCVNATEHSSGGPIVPTHFRPSCNSNDGLRGGPTTSGQRRFPSLSLRRLAYRWRRGVQVPSLPLPRSSPSHRRPRRSGNPSIIVPVAPLPGEPKTVIVPNGRSRGLRRTPGGDFVQMAKSVRSPAKGPHAMMQPGVLPARVRLEMPHDPWTRCAHHGALSSRAADGARENPALSRCGELRASTPASSARIEGRNHMRFSRGFPSSFLADPRRASALQRTHAASWRRPGDSLPAGLVGGASRKRASSDACSFVRAWPAHGGACCVCPPYRVNL